MDEKKLDAIALEVLVRSIKKAKFMDLNGAELMATARAMIVLDDLVAKMKEDEKPKPLIKPIEQPVKIKKPNAKSK
jgi:hypothetical protein